MKIERLMFFGDSFAMEKSDKQNCWKTLLSEKLDNIPIGHWGQGGSSMESCYNDFYNYIKNDYSKTDLCVFCWTDLNRRSLVWENKLKSVNISSILEDNKKSKTNDFIKIMKEILYQDNLSEIKQSVKISEMSYFATNYLLEKHNVQNLQYFCFADDTMKESLKFNLVTYLKSFEDYNKKDFLNVLDHFSPLAAIDFSNKVLKDLQEKYV